MSVLTIIFIFSWLIQMVFLILFTIKYVNHEKRIINNKQVKGEEISIIVCARNELDNLKHNFYYLLNQKSNQSLCELIIVNDGSTDGTKQFLEDKLAKHSNFKLINITPEEKVGGKKTALNQGVMLAKGEYIILTDADCKPSTDSWAMLMAQRLLPVDKKIVIGLAPYNYKSTLVNNCVQYETTLTAFLYSGFALCGMPYMGVGRNMGYKKSFYVETGGVSKQPKKLNSGDDDMFVNQNATAHNVAFCSNKEAQCFSPAPETFKAWFYQKKRHLSTSTYYKNEHKILLSFYSISHFLYIGTLFVVTFTNSTLALLFFSIRSLALIFIFKKIRFTSNLFNYITVLFNDAIHIFYYIIISLFSILVQKNNWK